ncbi:MAG: 50S ribosomal protein L4 [Candidatus Omnitrophota bacterium]|nr:50S ribosomal protein L4 [Candidatus Omnitrophota bacterium]
MATFPLYNVKGEEIEKIVLPENIFDGTINRDLLHRAVVMYNANRRQGTASTKTRGEVSGGGIKPWKQKGTGRARAGSNRSPLWRHGGVVFGPHPRDFRSSMPEKMRNEALRSSINDKLVSQNLILLEHLDIKVAKTKEIVGILSSLKIKERILIVIDEKERNERVVKATRNIHSVTLSRAMDINAYDVLSHKKLLVTKFALKTLTSRLK